MTFSWENANRQEVIFACQLVIGLCFACWALFDCVLDFHHLWKLNGDIRQDDKRIRRITIIGNLRAEIVRLLPQIFCAILVLYALQMPSRGQAEIEAMNPIQRQRYMWAFGAWVTLWVYSLGLTINSMWNFRDRRSIRRILLFQEDNRGEPRKPAPTK